MKTPRFASRWARLTALFLLGLTGPAACAFDQTHAALTAVLTSRVKDGTVDYKGLKAEPNGLGGYLSGLAAVKEPEFKSWTKDERLAFLINLYNAQTLKLIIDHHPVKSIRDIGGLRGPWKQKVVHVFGGLRTLDEIEHEWIRPQYDEPRAHFALVCAARSCPPLRAEAYRADRLDAQLEEQGRVFLRQTSKNRVDAKTGTLHLSRIFEWFADDFTATGKTVPAFVAPYFPEREAALIRAGGLKTAYTEYDWSLNGR